MQHRGGLKDLGAIKRYALSHLYVGNFAQHRDGLSMWALLSFSLESQVMSQNCNIVGHDVDAAN